MAGLALAGMWWLLVQAGVLSGPLATAAMNGPDAEPVVAGGPVGPVADIPPGYLSLYRRSGSACRGLDWALLAAVGKVETDHGRSRLPGVRSGTNSAGAAGPMQFLRPTWREVRRDNPQIGADLYNPSNAIPGAAAYLCDSGLADGAGVRATRTALWSYNHSSAYADDVLAHAARYRTAAARAGGERA